ncbi:SGNH/GDSL hydrolase family protein [Streptomyces sp. 184]|uniref:SGNH/GDSL hydrolase family protein n=1 Tax=Streptomyces sp. 184 TaxID=1827526 RepID=UPI0038929D1A
MTIPGSHEVADEDLDALSSAPWRRVVVIGDSIAEGVGEPTPGFPDVPWATTVMNALGRSTGGERVEYLNLGRRDLLAEEIRAGQLAPALAFEPDLALVTAGGNDLLRRRFDLEAVAGHLDAIVVALRKSGADVVTLGLFDCSGSPYVPEAMRTGMTERLRALGARTAAIAAAHGAAHVPLTDDPLGAAPDIYGSDGLHLNRRGHAATAARTVHTLVELLAGSGKAARTET